VGAGLKFRPDLNGLRAIAVLAVLAYHFGLSPLGGGFVGVDFFFVISGYLMTRIILGGIEQNTFSVAAFYLDRARRIVPALAVLVIVLLIFGAATLLPDELMRLAREGSRSVLFVSNIIFWRETNYFEPGIDQKWLLHSWSLSLEWQFYLIYPLALRLLARTLPRIWLVAVLAIGAALSFAGMILLGQFSSGAAFFLLPPRAWELLAGALIYFAAPLSGLQARAAQIGGLALIACSIVLTSGEGWPGASAAVPVCGTALVILAARTNSRLTGNKVFQWIGLASYSIYLWHWPIVVWLRRGGLETDWRWVAAGLALSFLLGWLSWRFVERRFQSRRATDHLLGKGSPGSGKPLAVYGLAALTPAVACLVILQLDGLPERYSAEVRAIAKAGQRVEIPGTDNCFFRRQLHSSDLQARPVRRPRSSDHDRRQSRRGAARRTPFRGRR
jgi:peptidoglycan/LPS O-acetylase OafA/YrhL